MGIAGIISILIGIGLISVLMWCGGYLHGAYNTLNECPTPFFMRWFCGAYLFLKKKLSK